MTRTFCTIFNAVYLVRGLALIDSLARHCPDHRIYVFAMDPQTADILSAAARPQVIVVREGEFETPELRRVKPERGIAEYFWTCTPHIVRHCLSVRGHEECTYVDADIWFMSDPEPLFAEMGPASVLLTEHRYTPRHEAAGLLRGTYCVQFMRFVADPRGLRALDWWCERCIEWCHARLEDGKFGDQKYLDDWTTRFEGVHVLKHTGGGVAPWNVQRTEFRDAAGAVQVRDRLGQARGDWQPLVFFHFHGLLSYGIDSVCFAFGFSLSPGAKRWIYRPYVRELCRHFEPLRSRLSGLAAQGIAPGASNSGSGLRRWARRLWGLPNTVSLKRLARD
jgi:hypothetical protein